MEYCGDLGLWPENGAARRPSLKSAATYFAGREFSGRLKAVTLPVAATREGNVNHRLLFFAKATEQARIHPMTLLVAVFFELAMSETKQPAMPMVIAGAVFAAKD